MGDDQVMRIGIRADANEMIATGHVMRCLAIADALRNIGEEPLFISADDFSQAMIKQKGYEFVSLKSDWKYPECEIEKLEQVINKYDIGILLVDSYYVTVSYFEKIHGLAKIMYIDDLGQDVYNVDAVVCYANYYKDFSLKEKYPPKVKLLQGTEYTPLRNVFSNLPPKKISSGMRELIVLSGGTDNYNFLWGFSKRILKSPLFDALETIHIICGKYYDKYDELIQEFKEIAKFQFHKAVDHIETYMLSADVAISAAGVSSYELCAVGTPTILYTMADNQRRNAESFYKDEIMEYVGDLRDESVLDRIIELLQEKYQDMEYRKKVSEIMRKKVDGKGAQRIAKKICGMLKKKKL